MLQRRRHDAAPQTTSPMSPSERETLASLTTLMGEMPELPFDVMQQVLAVLPQLPQAARMAASQLIAGKASHDFAMRFLLRLRDALAVSADHAATFDMNKPLDQAAVTRLLQEWVKLLTTARISSIESLRRVLVSALGLQIMMDAAPHADQRSWIFDASTQYRVVLRDADALIAPPRAIQWTTTAPVRTYVSSQSFTPMPLEVDKQESLHLFEQQTHSAQFEVALPLPPPSHE